MPNPTSTHEVQLQLANTMKLRQAVRDLAAATGDPELLAAEAEFVAAFRAVQAAAEKLAVTA